MLFFTGKLRMTRRGHPWSMMLLKVIFNKLQEYAYLSVPTLLIQNCPPKLKMENKSRKGQLMIRHYLAEHFCVLFCVGYLTTLSPVDIL